MRHVHVHLINDHLTDILVSPFLLCSGPLEHNLRVDILREKLRILILFPSSISKNISLVSDSHLASHFVKDGVFWLVLDQTYTLQFRVLVVQFNEVCLYLPHIGQAYYWKHIACIH